MTDDGRIILEAIGGLKEELKDVKEDVKSIKNDVVVLKTDVCDLKTEVKSLNVRVGHLEEDVTVLKADVAELKEDVSGLKTEVKSLNVRVGHLEEDVAVMKEDIKILNTRMGLCEIAITDLKDEVRDVKLIMETEVKTGISLLAEQYQTLSNKLDDAIADVKKSERLTFRIEILERDMKKVMEYVHMPRGWKGSFA